MAYRLALVTAVFLPLVALGARAAETKVKTGGEAEVSIHTYLKDSDPEGAVPGRTEMQLQPHVKVKHGVFTAYVQLQARHDFENFDRSLVRFKDAYLQLRWGGLRVRAGNQVLRWGRMDMRPALDLMTPKDFDELWAPEQIGAPALLLQYGHPSFSATAAWLPFFKPGRYSTSNKHRWNVLLSQPSVGVAGSESFPIHYQEYRDAQTPDDAGVLDSQLGLRLEFFLPAVDLALQGYYGRDLLPTYHEFEGLNGDVMEPNAQDLITFLDQGVDVALTPMFAHKGVVGGDMALVLGPVVVKGELAYTITTDPSQERCDVPDPYLQGTIGAEWIANDLIGDQDLAIRFEVAGDHELPADDVINRDDHCTVPETRTPIRDVNHISVLSFYGNVQWTFVDGLMLDVRGFTGIEGDYLVRIELSTTVRGMVRLGLAGLITGGRDGSFMSYYDRNDRMEFTTTFLF